MPISALQHRISTGNHQNYRKTNNNIINTLKIKPNCPTLSDEIRHFVSKIVCISNASEVLNTQSNLHSTPQNITAIAIQFMLLLGQIKNLNHPILTANHDLQFMPERKTLFPASDHALQLYVDNYGLNTIWNPIVNTFNEADKFISRHDPLKFPGTNAVPLCESSNLPNDFVSAMNYRGINIIARGLDQLKCIDRDKYRFFKRTAYNAVRLLDSTIQQLNGKKNNRIDNPLKDYGFVNIDFFKQKLVPLYETIRSEIRDMLKNKDSIYYGYLSIPQIKTHKVANMVLMNDKERRMLLTDTFFKLRTVHAIEMFLYEMCHFHSRIDLFLISPKKSGLINRNKTLETSIQDQLDEAENFYIYSINNLKEDKIPTHEAISFVYKTDKKHFLEAFNTDETFREDAIFINADSITHLAIALGNYGFKKNSIMPLRDIST